ncbi:YtxH domain-containing protein [Babesia caballi]|uniref:YtxH domain-containing protein n=1 Tax=Babesia caballi TaxID=5871 RepID=A0AAV4M0W0_BABCB|nr:YtxH domain-containing protein [Babesia caballi]
MGCCFSKTAPDGDSTEVIAPPAVSTTSEPMPDPEELQALLTGYEEISICGEQPIVPTGSIPTDGEGFVEEVKNVSDATEEREIRDVSADELEGTPFPE